MGVKIRTGEDATAQMSFEDGSSLLMGGNSVISVRSFDYDEEAQSRVLIVDLISGSIAYDIFSDGLSASLAKIVTPTSELSVHGTEGVFEYDVATLSASSTVLEVVRKVMTQYLVSYFQARMVHQCLLRSRRQLVQN